MKSLEEIYCQENRCAAEEFPRRVFGECLYRHAVPFVPLLGGYRSAFFAADRGLILAAGRATRRAHVQASIVDYFSDSESRGWLKSRLNLRISTRRLVRLSKQYLPASDTRPPMGDAKQG